MILNETSEIFILAIASGWRITSCSCTCGGRYAWVKPNGEMYGCICHNDIKKEI